MRSLQDTIAANERAAVAELAELRSDAIRLLRSLHKQGGTTAVVHLLIEAGIVPPEAATLRKVAA